MSWPVIDRNTSVVDPDAPPLLSEGVCEKIRAYTARYERKQAALLPALHLVQNTIGHVPWQAMEEVATLLDIHPSEVLDTLSFYTHFWTHPKGKKVVTVCRSLTCELLGGAAVLDELKSHLGVDEHGTTEDGRYSLMTEECLAGCDHAPCLLVNEKLHRCVKPEDIEALLADDNNDRLTMQRSDLFDPPPEDIANKQVHGTSSGDAGSTPQSSVGEASHEE